MRVLSNVEFERLTTKQSYRLQAIAKRRADRDPEGCLQLDEIPEYIQACTYSGDHKSASWLKSLVTITKNGQIDRIRHGAETFKDHQKYINTLKANGSIKFDLNDSVQCKDSGRYGQVVDYMPETKEYVVILDPFQVKMYKESDMLKVG